MAERSDMDSDGSDIEVSSEEESASSDSEDTGQFIHEGPSAEFVHFLDQDDDDQGDFEGFDRDWVRENFTPRVRRGYTGLGGAIFQHPEEARPIHYFELFWGQDLWEMLVRETNRYASQQRAIHPPPTFAPKWRPVDIRTLMAFLGLTFVMGILRLPFRNDYWRTTKRMFRTNFNTIMARDRFNLVWRYLHISNNEDQLALAVPDRLFKIRPLIDYLNGKFMTMYLPYGDVTVDETMVKFKGRLIFRQYVPAKPTKWGVKLWTLAESTTGYLHKFQVYCGKENNIQEKGLSHRVVTDLVNHLHYKNVRVFMDNFYSSPDLFTNLLGHGVYACGTVRSNRKGLPTELLPKNIRQDKHQYQMAQKDNLTFCNWVDTKPVLFLSNYHDPEAVGTVNRRTGHQSQQQVHVPKVVEDYQAGMKGVDLCDQMCGYYIIQHRSKKWWRRLFHHLQMASAYNAYIVAKDTNPEHVKKEWPMFKNFLEDLAEDLIGDFTPSRSAPQPSRPTPAVFHNITNMFPKKKSCQECRAKAAQGQRVTATKQGCRECKMAVCKKCVAGHIQRA